MSIQLAIIDRAWVTVEGSSKIERCIIPCRSTTNMGVLPRTKVLSFYPLSDSYNDCNSEYGYDINWDYNIEEDGSLAATVLEVYCG